MPKIISLKDAIKLGIEQIFRNESLGFMVKSQMLNSFLGIIFIVPLLISFFSILQPTTNQTYSATSVTMVQPNPNSMLAQPTYILPGAFGITMLVLGLVLMGIYSVASLNLFTLSALRIANGKTGPVVPILKLSYRRTLPMVLHLLIKGVLLLVGYLLFIVPGVILSIKFCFSGIVLLGENLGPIAALKRSSEITKGYKMNIYLKSAGLACLQFILIVPIIIAAVALGNSAVGPIPFLIYAFVVHLIFINIYQDILKVKSNAAATPAISTETDAPVATLA